jgi:hypothetical protein
MTRRFAALWLWLQAAVIAAWWLCLWLWPGSRAPFVVGDWPEATLFAFWPADVAVLVVGSALAARAVQKGARQAPALVWALAGAAVYATLWCLGTNLATGSGWLGTSLMLPCAAGMLLCARAAGKPASAAETPA